MNKTKFTCINSLFYIVFIFIFILIFVYVACKRTKIARDLSASGRYPRRRKYSDANTRMLYYVGTLF